MARTNSAFFQGENILKCSEVLIEWVVTDINLDIYRYLGFQLRLCQRTRTQQIRFEHVQ